LVDLISKKTQIIKNEDNKTTAENSFTTLSGLKYSNDMNKEWIPDKKLRE
jgi:hypothetical protein